MVPESAEALTDTGWRVLKHINVGDFVATLNLSSGEIEYQPVLCVKRDVCDELFNVCNAKTLNASFSATH